MIRAVLALIPVAVSFVFAGCADKRQPHQGKPDTKEAQAKVEAKKQTLTANAAKRALLDMDVGQIPPGVLVPPPEDEPIKIGEPDEISIGRYHCNLKEKTYHASARYPHADRHRFNDVNGVFELNADGKWVAKIAGASSGH
jgi:hypothetical protein